jgi:hypothetical protein
MVRKMFRPVTGLALYSAFFPLPSSLGSVGNGSAHVIGRYSSTIKYNDVGNNMKRQLSVFGNPNGNSSVAKKIKITTDSDILHYIEENGFGEPIPQLRKGLSADVFKQHYYDKNELMDFCRSVGISTTGLKQDLNDRIEIYLRTGLVTVVQPAKTSKRADSEEGLSLSKQVVNYKSDPITRAFFARHIPEFTGFSALVQKQIKQRLADGETFTYSDAIEMHKAFLQNRVHARVTGQATTVAHDSCQYNQFSIDYNHDQSRKLHAMIDAWMLVRNSAGAKTYQRYKDKIEEIRGLLTQEAQVETPSMR